jgi:hypothetical protein
MYDTPTTSRSVGVEVTGSQLIKISLFVVARMEQGSSGVWTGEETTTCTLKGHYQWCPDLKRFLERTFQGPIEKCQLPADLILNCS